MKTKDDLDYVSPIVVGTNGEDLEMEFSGYKDILGMQLKQNQNNSFKIQITSSLITETKSTRIVVKYKLKNSTIWSQVETKVEIAFK